MTALKNSYEKQGECSLDLNHAELGELACKHGLHQFDVALLDEAFAKLAVSLRQQPAE